MFVHHSQVPGITGITVTANAVVGAQHIIESYIGRSEADVTDPNDLALLARATAYQAAYIQGNAETVFQQVGASTIAHNGEVITFKGEGAPFLAPLAVIACKGLSWRKSRSVQTGRVASSGPRMSYADYWRFD